MNSMLKDAWNYWVSIVKILNVYNILNTKQPLLNTHIKDIKITYVKPLNIFDYFGIL